MQKLKTFLGTFLAIYLGSITFSYSYVSYDYFINGNNMDIGYSNMLILLAIWNLILSVITLILYMLFYNLFLRIKLKNIILYFLTLLIQFITILCGIFLSDKGFIVSSPLFVFIIYINLYLLFGLIYSTILKQKK